MKQRLGIIFGLAVVVGLLIILSLATLQQRDETRDTEAWPNRSSFNPGATGTLAFYTLLSESGQNVIRWRERPENLQFGRRGQPGTIILIGQTRKPIAENDLKKFLRWTAAGGTFIVVDRELWDGLSPIAKAGGFKVKENDDLLFGGSVDPYDSAQMTYKTPAARPVQPSGLVSGVVSVQPSRFASSILLENPHPEPFTDAAPIAVRPAVIHISEMEKGILADVEYGEGRIILLSDPFIVSNAGLPLADNAILALQIASSGSGPIAFDEYHQGFGSGENAILQYFAGTPLPWIALQGAILFILFAFSSSRRFARPLDRAEPNRLARLEYISAMAELQKSTRAFDLALENIYGSLKRRAANLFCVDNSAAGRKRLPALIAARTGRSEPEVEALFARCEDIIRGDRSSKNEVVQLVTNLRRLELDLGLLPRRQKSAE
jgi:hypothetical protein